MKEQFWSIKSCNLFADLSDEWLRHLEKHGRVREFSAKSPLTLRPGESGYVYLVLSGVVKLTHLTEEGKETILAFLEAGELFGEYALLDSKESSEHVQAVKSSQIMAFPVEVLQDLIREEPALGFELTKLMGLRRLRIERRLKNLLFVSNRERVIHLLLDLAEQFGVETPHGTRLRIPFSHQDLANLIGVTRESITNQLGQMRDEGLVEIGRQKLVLLDLRRLGQIVCRKVRGRFDPEREPGQRNSPRASSLHFVMCGASSC